MQARYAGYSEGRRRRSSRRVLWHCRRRSSLGRSCRGVALLRVANQHLELFNKSVELLQRRKSGIALSNFLDQQRFGATSFPRRSNEPVSRPIQSVSDFQRLVAQGAQGADTTRARGGRWRQRRKARRSRQQSIRNSPEGRLDIKLKGSHPFCLASLVIGTQVLLWKPRKGATRILFKSQRRIIFY